MAACRMEHRSLELVSLLLLWRYAQAVRLVRDMLRGVDGTLREGQGLVLDLEQNGGASRGTRPIAAIDGQVRAVRQLLHKPGLHLPGTLLRTGRPGG
jgi:hypothetical protein